MFAMEVYTGADDKSSHATHGREQTLEKLFAGLDFESHKYRHLFADNWHCSVLVAVWLFVRCGMCLTGAVRALKKRSRTADDFPHGSLGKTAQKHAERGWFRRAMQERKLKVPWAVQKVTLWVQGLIWKDQKWLASLTQPILGLTK